MFVRFVIALFLIACQIGSPPFSTRQASWDFEADEPGQIAQGFTNEAGRWEVVNDADNRVLAQKAENGHRVFNVTFVDQTSYRDVDLRVRMKAVAGENERGGGLVWRAKDKENYYFACYNPLKAYFRIYKVENGNRTQLDHAEAPGNDTESIEMAGAEEWHTLRITMMGHEIVGYFDGKKLLQAEDSTILDVGKIGLWSKSDARSYFDDLTISSVATTRSHASEDHE